MNEARIPEARIKELLAITGYTLGPWGTRPYGGYIISKVPPDGGPTIAQIQEPYWKLDKKSAKANAALITASPDIQAALAQVVAERDRLREAVDILLGFDPSAAVDTSIKYNIEAIKRDVASASVNTKRLARAALKG